MIPVRRAVHLQEAVARGEVEIQWISRESNPSDVLTHQSSNAEFKRCLEQLGLELRPDILNNTCPRGSVEILSFPLVPHVEQRLVDPRWRDRSIVEKSFM